ncbi:MAG: hypothetical protein GY801_07380 [bacterium]|nr:hypothetical protein [bacterium]
MSKKLSIIIVVFILFISWGIHSDLKTEKPDQPILLEQIRMLGFQKVHGIDILIANIEEGIIERKSLNQKEIAFVQGLLKNADTRAVGGHNYLIYTCKLIFYLEEGHILNFSGKNYGQYNYNKEDLYLSPERRQDLENQRNSYKRLEPIRIKYLGKWIITHVNVRIVTN